MKDKWTCQLCGKKDLWYKFEVKHSPQMCYECWLDYKKYEKKERKERGKKNETKKNETN